MVAQPQLAGNAVGVHGIELNIVVRDVLLHVAGQILFQLRAAPGSVQQECAAVLDLVDHVIAADIGLGMAGQEIRGLDEIGGANRLFTEPKMALGNAVGLLGVILEIRLGVHPCVVADDFGGVFIGTHGAVRPQAPELAGHRAGGFGDQRLPHVQGQMCHIIHHTDGKGRLWRGGIHVVKDGLDLGGGHILGGKAIAAAIDLGGMLIIGIGGADIQVHRPGNGAGFLGPVQRRDLFYGFGHLAEEVLHVKGPEQVNLKHAHLLAPGVQEIHHLFGGLAGGTHQDNDPVGVPGAVVIKDMIVPAGDPVDSLHIALHQSGDGVICAVVGL